MWNNISIFISQYFIILNLLVILKMYEVRSTSTTIRYVSEFFVFIWIISEVRNSLNSESFCIAAFWCILLFFWSVFSRLIGVQNWPDKKENNNEWIRMRWQYVKHPQYRKNFYATMMQCILVYIVSRGLPKMLDT